MVYWTILFYQVYRNHAKSNGIKPLFFFEAKGLLSQPHLLFFNESSVLDIEGEGSFVYWTW
jgi:hypothetical protein